MNAITYTVNPLKLAATSKQDFHFRSFPRDPAKQTKAQAADLAAHPALFAEFTAKVRNKSGGVDEIPSWKRRSVEGITVTYPDFLLTLEDAALQALVVNAVDRYVKTTFIDQFAEVGDHSWAVVAAGIVSAFENTSAKGGGSGAPDEELLERAQAVWDECIKQLSAGLAATTGELFAKRVTDAQLSKALAGNVTEIRLRRLLERVQQVAAVVADPENAALADTAPAFAYAIGRIESRLSAMAALSDDEL